MALVELREWDKARHNLQEANRLAGQMRAAGLEADQKSVLRAEATLLHASNRVHEALDTARKHLALLPTATGASLTENFDLVDVLRRIRIYSKSIDPEVCKSASEKLIRIWSDLKSVYPQSAFIKTQHEREVSSGKNACLVSERR